MPDDQPQRLSETTVRRMAQDVVRLPLTEAMVEPVRSTLEGLFNEIAAIKPEDREGFEPLSQVILEEWSR